ncbi:hypothetical protein CANTEDRAFT_130138 [Yamadazyma tenuis ATCC 10573]|uniref:Zn(2)-C6 fungal-type domain-containing protein n=1 Tax=Candida tenuis (strain ATCC 10573 / BCRC 21748 / CBS 615 / JCM 9827 / NBRC 10315 / NRRL Y-1498 / VKM Y-70) TaxID=590646 RepID=G3B3S0_CANTC|nr:uncharacterized protein CANTEDRAFT_130138 [Yamadazyma tenuis ATCC 10573]XP_006686757.1 uncharacterized protein CANTEDRAFT_130138 [Yamadazyma tenuis ATCC 10573]EGV64442.1 hypothetical protein CANTEDRAFT_130138 [Yamadazyma tenuis ATCC 10573]EGV64443.1 hypothetical protein CANTEDRAFT_130138 [Yamadazyma tenuis ATCC 10573]
MTEPKQQRAIKKRKYSRAGCQECKRRKIKCDEFRPICQNCSKAKKECSFQSSTAAPDESTKGDSSGLESYRVVSVPSVVSTSNGKAVSSSTTIKPPVDGQYGFSNFADSSLSFPSGTNPIRSQSPPNSQNGADVSKSRDILSYSTGNDEHALYSSASVFAHDLTDLLEVRMDDIPENLVDYRTPLFEDKSPLKSISEDLFNDHSIQNLIVAYDMVDGYKNYLRLFYEKYSLWLMPLSPVSGSKNFFKKVIIHQAQRYPFLLNAIFSITAAFEYEATKSPTDEYYRRFYVSLSLKGLKDAFDHMDKNNDVIHYIEPLILTSLLFVTQTAAATNGSWRDHLRGANNLFKQYLSIRKVSSPVILIATTWFASFEIIASMTNPVGGSIKTEELLEDILLPILYKDDWNLAIQLGLVLPSGYNVFLGQSSATVFLFIRFLKLSLKIKNSAFKIADSDDLLEIASLAEQALKLSVTSQNGLIEPTSPYHPKTNGINFLPYETYGYKDDIVFSWFDISDKIHLRGLYLTVLTDPMYFNLPVESLLVQDVVHKILDMCHFYHGIDFSNSDTFDFDAVIKANPILHDRRLLMLHSSLLKCGLCCVDKVDRLRIQLYFKSMISFGATTVENSYRQIQAGWRGDKKNLDFVPYL